MTMTTSDQFKDDLNYVATTLRRSEPIHGVPAIYYLWAVIILVGWALPDFAPVYAGPFWVIAGPLGGIVSAIIGWRSDVRAGEQNRVLGMRYAWHWSLAGLACVLVALPVASGTPISHVVPYFLLIIGLAYALAGVHLEAPLRWVGLLMMAGYIALILGFPFAWTTTGVVVAAALSYTGWQARR